jgi:hypothetical protein
MNEFPRSGSSVETKQPFGKAAFKNNNSNKTQPKDLLFKKKYFTFPINSTAKKSIKKLYIDKNRTNYQL